MKWWLFGIVACAPPEGAHWSGRYAVEGFEASPACLDVAVDADPPSDWIAISVGSSQLDLVLCEGETCVEPWWSGWADSVGPRRVRGSVSQALGSPSADGTPLCSVAWSEVLIEEADDAKNVKLEGEIWQADGVPLEPYLDCWEVLRAYAESDETPCVGAWRFALASPT